MAAKFTRLTHKILIRLQRAVAFAVLAPGGKFGNFWIHHLTFHSWKRFVKETEKQL